MANAEMLEPVSVSPAEMPLRIAENPRVYLAALFQAGGFQSGAEIGVARGLFAELLCRAIPNLSLLCVDPWAKYHGNPRAQDSADQASSFEEAKARLAPYRATIRREMSMDAVERVPLKSLDFVFIDGNHCYDYVLADLEAWSARVRQGGIVAGDDYYDFPKAGVVGAVQTFTALHKIAPWWVIEPKWKNHRGVTQPAYFWVQA